MLNYIVMMGRLTHDPELRRTQAGDAVCSFRIACDRDYKTKSGEKETDFIDVVAWRGVAETTAKYFAKGRMAVVEGRLQIRPWTDKDGNKRSTTEIVASHVRFGDSKPKDTSGDAYSDSSSSGNYSNGSYSTRGNGGYNGGSAYSEPVSVSQMPDDWVPDYENDGELPF